MAIKKDYLYTFKPVANLPWGAEWSEDRTETLSDSYIKVLRVEGTKDQQTATVQIASADKQFVSTYSFVPDLAGKNFIAQAYEHLKTLPEFADATDC